MPDRREELQMCCPYCLATLQHLDSGLVCGNCGRGFEVSHGIPCLAQNSAYYYGEIPQPVMKDLLSEISTTQWDAAFRRALRSLEDPVGVIDYALREGRAGWMYLLPLHLKPRVLDVGCGPGAITLALAQKGCRVVGLDLTVERLEFMQARARELGLDNVFPIHGGDTPYLPFPAGYFDLVILNGVLEWAPQTRRGKPEEAQLEFLREVRRILKPDGIVYIGIENRFSWNYFLGRPEDHTGLRFVSLLPRPLANLYSRMMMRKPYTTHTYSLAGYTRLLRAAGLDVAKTYLPMPDYRDFSLIVDRSAPQSVNAFFDESERKRHVPVWARAWMARNLSPAFGILAGSGREPRQSFLTRVLQTLAEELHSKRQAGPSVIERYLVTGTDTVVVKVGWPRLAESWILKLPISSWSCDRCSQQHENLKRVRSAVSNLPELFPEISEPLASGQIEGIPYFVERALPGMPWRQFKLMQADCDAGTISAVDFLARFHRTVLRHERTAEAHLVPRLQAMVETLDPFVSAEAASQLDHIKAFIVESLCGKVLPHLLTHGDYWLHNLLFDHREAKVSGVLDWDFASFGVVSLRDVLHLLLTAKSELSGLPPAVTAVAFVADKSRDEALERLLTLYCEAIGLHLDSKMRAAFGLLYWLELLHCRLAHSRSRYRVYFKWIRENVLEPIPEFYSLACSLGPRVSLRAGAP